MKVKFLLACGRYVFYPDCPVSESILRLMSRKTFSKDKYDELKRLAGLLGIEIECNAMDLKGYDEAN